jgi:hypothetical protein
LLFSKPAKTGAGGYAQQRYERGLTSWRQQIRWPLVLVMGPFFAASLAIYATHERDGWMFLAGALFGMALVMTSVLRDEPPAYIASWRRGAEGERKTAKALQPLLGAGWHAAHDLQDTYGNVDHVVVGPGGVFLLETKNWEAVVDVIDGVPRMRRRHDPDFDRGLDRLPRQLLAAAVRLKHDIERVGGERTWVQAVLVLWCDFEAGVVEGDRCFFVHGDRLAEWLRERPATYPGVRVDRIRASLDQIAAQGRAPARA